jgi:predicted Fe-Mo cluster-binding NifX family protein
MSTDTVCMSVTPDEQVGHGWGRAALVAVAEVEDGVIVSWRVEPVGWDVLHDAPGEGNHHARVVRFLQDNGVAVAVAEQMGEPMQVMLSKLGIRVVLGASGDARSAILSATA